MTTDEIAADILRGGHDPRFISREIMALATAYESLRAQLLAARADAFEECATLVDAQQQMLLGLAEHGSEPHKIACENGAKICEALAELIRLHLKGASHA